jgi:hypothetical protein
VSAEAGASAQWMVLARASGQPLGARPGRGPGAMLNPLGNPPGAAQWTSPSTGTKPEGA